MDKKDLVLGIDIGSVSVKTALLDADGTLLADSYARIKGDPVSTLRGELTKLFERTPESRIVSAGITGSGGKQVAAALGADFVNEILAQSAFAGAFHPSAKTIIEMGGEDAKLIILHAERDGRSRIEDFAHGSVCRVQLGGCQLQRIFHSCKGSIGSGK